MTHRVLRRRCAAEHDADAGRGPAGRPRELYSRPDISRVAVGCSGTHKLGEATSGLRDGVGGRRYLVELRGPLP